MKKMVLIVMWIIPIFIGVAGFPNNVHANEYLINSSAVLGQLQMPVAQEYVYIMPSPGDSCGLGEVYDCAFNCVAESTVNAWLGDGLCDDGTWGVELWCIEFSNDIGDCLYNPGDSCAYGKVFDCNLGCVNETTAQSWVGDGYCDDGQYGMKLRCDEFNFDGGDCYR